ncbi:MAG: transglutaminase-like domain-containing protein [Anaerolineae bacterium]|nr:transglutaminase-like domain-containing protein [Anaerolineae bacterium]
MVNPLEFFASHGRISSPGRHVGLLAGLPGDVGLLCRIIQGFMVHLHWAERYGLQVPPERRDEVQLRSVAQRLQRIIELDDRPLAQGRALERRVVGNCRDYALMLAALLREQGVPARARCGFGRYFLPNHYEDHWIAEYWNAAQERWVLVDPQLDEFQRQKLSLAFDPLDVPRDQFVVGGEAWRLCRSGQADPETFGIFDMHGLWFVRGNLVRDLASLNKVELLPWDAWGIIDARDEDLSADDLALLDQVAELTSGDVPGFNRVRQLYETDDRLRVPATIRSYTEAGPVMVDLTGI